MRSVLKKVNRQFYRNFPKEDVKAVFYYQYGYWPVYDCTSHAISSFPFSNNISKDFWEADNEGAVYKILDGIVWGNIGTVLSPDGFILSDVSNCFVSEPSQHILFKQWRWKKPVNLKGLSAVVVTTGSNSYYHWLLQNFPRLHLLQMAGFFNQIDHFLLSYYALPFQKECLDRIDFPMEKMLLTNNMQDLFCAEQLLIPSLPFKPYGYDNVNLWALNFVRSIFLGEKTEPSKSRKIYISRSKSLGRKIANEVELFLVLERYGFEYFHLENLRIFEQAELFSQASVVIGAHGAGLANIVFCKSALVIDIFNDKFVNPCFWDISNKLDLKYIPYFGSSFNSGDVKEDKHLDILVDVKEFKKVLSRALNS